MSAVAQIAHTQGYQVSGCDINLDTPYISKISNLKSQISLGHSADHLKDVDILAVTPAVFYQNDSHPETSLAREKNILMTWQEFMGNYLHKNKYLICIAGTHGKSTTTALAGLLLEAAGLDPTVEVGATVPAWHTNVRAGKSKYFISEADEFHDNFASYRPDIIILNNIEMDHPEYFHTIDRLLQSFQKFIDHLKPGGTLIYNSDSPLVHKLKLPPNSIPYTLSEFDFKLSIPGNHNKSNALGVIKLAQLLKLDQSVISNILASFTGIDRRIQLLGEKNGVKVYDDYANHPTAFAASIAGVKELNPESKIWVVIEPHTFSRLRAVLSDLPASVSHADEIIVSKVFASRETDPGNFSGADIATAAGGKYIPEFPDIVSTLRVETRPGDVILVMGSGDSYKLSRQILSSL
ncbi:hypothetical protein HYW29_01800 [Candidatus Amesbacteria bacterium]|nr:hypothetical protein [Candidatus Amesbacteria bacterium]